MYRLGKMSAMSAMSGLFKVSIMKGENIYLYKIADIADIADIFPKIPPRDQGIMYELVL
jgi:hypothetical protein